MSPPIITFFFRFRLQISFYRPLTIEIWIGMIYNGIKMELDYIAFRSTFKCNMLDPRLEKTSLGERRSLHRRQRRLKE